MTEHIPPTPADGTTAFPDVDDPVALEEWLDGIEKSSERVIARQAFVLDMAEAQHQIVMLKTRPLPTWENPASQRRAWRLIYAGFALSFIFTIALDRLDGTSPAHVAFLALLPIACLVWLFLCAYEVVKRYRYRAMLRADRDTKIAALEAERDSAQAHFDDLDNT